MSLCFGQLAIAYLLKGDMEQAQAHFMECIKIAKDLRAVRMQLECLLCMAYISFDKKEWQDAQTYFNHAFAVAKECSESNIAEQCLCNSGIASGNAAMERAKNQMMQTFYAGSKATGGLNGGNYGESWSDEDEDEEGDEDDRAEYGGEDVSRRMYGDDEEEEDAAQVDDF